MPKVSREDAPNVENQGPAVDRWADLDGYRAEFVTINVDSDLTPLLVGLPDDQCQCPHWGYVFTGRLWFRFDGREESYGPGDAFYVRPGHTAGADAGAEFLVFAPSDKIAALEAHMMKRARQLQSA